MSTQVFRDGILREEWNDVTHMYSAWTEDEVLVEGTPRPYTLEENNLADINIAAEQASLDAEKRRVASDALVDATLILSESAHEAGQAWMQPTGAHDAYPVDATVTHGGKDWVSLAPFNVWIPGVSGWREVVAEGFPAWIQPTGAHDDYDLGAQVSHNGQNWESTSAANVWEPGVFGWVAI